MLFRSVRKLLAEAKIASAEEAAKKLIADAIKEADSKKRETILEAKEDIHKLRTELDNEIKERRQEQQRVDRRLTQREETLDRKLESVEKKEDNQRIKEAELEEANQKIQQLHQQQLLELERLSGLSRGEARELLLQNVQKETRHEAAQLIKEIENETKQEAEKRSREIISQTIQRYAADHVAETTVSVVSLPNDEMKGRIIGREGRNIRALETLTGIDLIIDDTPEAVIISGFDPVRREVARIALEKLIADGRIHPGRIEEMVNRAQKEVDNHIKEMGEQATFDTGIHGLHPELIDRKSVA